MEEWGRRGRGEGVREQARRERNTIGNVKEREGGMERGGIVMERLGSQFFIASSDLP